MTSKHDWVAAREAFVQGTASLDATARHYGIPPSALRRRAGAERWTQARNTFIAELAQERQAQTVQTLAEQGVEFDAAAHRTAERARALVEHRLRQLAALQAEGKPASADELLKLANTLRAVQATSHVARGESASGPMVSIDATTKPNVTVYLPDNGRDGPMVPVTPDEMKLMQMNPAELRTMMREVLDKI